MKFNKIITFISLFLLLCVCACGSENIDLEDYVEKDKYDSLLAELDSCKAALADITAERDSYKAELDYIKQGQPETTAINAKNVATEGINISSNLDGLETTVYQTTDDYIIEVVNSTGSNLSSITVSAVYYDESGSMITKEEDSIYEILSGTPTFYILSLPADYDASSYFIPSKADFTIDAKGTDNDYGYSPDFLNIESNIGNNGVMAQFTNTSDMVVTKIESIILYYDQEQLVGYDKGIFYDSLEPHNSYVEEFSTPQKAVSVGQSVSFTEKVSYDNYKIYIQTMRISK